MKSNFVKILVSMLCLTSIYDALFSESDVELYLNLLIVASAIVFFFQRKYSTAAFYVLTTAYIAKFIALRFLID